MENNSGINSPARPKIMIFEKDESMMESIVSDVVTFGFLIFCIWFSFYTKSTVWEFVTVIMFFVSLATNIPFGVKSKWVKIKTKQEALAWAESLED